jgi:NADPH-dependent curcumin reductase CurA
MHCLPTFATQDAVFDCADKYLDEFHDTVPRDLAAGNLKYLEHVYHGMDRVGEALVNLLVGINVGKFVLVLEDDV